LFDEFQNPEAMLRLGKTMMKGKGIKKNTPAGALLIEKAAHAGNAEAKTIIDSQFAGMT
jgi:TPR repeat protein